MAAIDVSTFSIAEATYVAMKGKVSFEDILAVWHGIGGCLKAQLALGKAVKLKGLGVFSLAVNNDPAFSMSADLTNQYRLKQAGAIPLATLPSSTLNFVQLSQLCGISRENCDKVYGKFMSCLGRSILEGRKITLTMNKVAEINIAGGALKCDFLSEFTNFINPPQKSSAPAKIPSAQLAAKLKEQKNEAERQLEEKVREERRQISASGVQADLAIRRRDRNPITGAGDTEEIRRPARRAIAGMSQTARPSSRGGSVASSGSRRSNADLLDSPRSQEIAFIDKSKSRPGLSREQLEQHSRTYAGRPGSAGSLVGKKTAAAIVSPRGGGGAGAGGTRPGSAGGKAMLDARAVAAKALSAEDIVQKVRDKIIQRGGSSGIKGLAKLLAIMDDNGDKKLSKEEMKYGLRDYGIDVTPMELDQIFLYFDRDRNGFVDITEFLVGMRGELSERRKKMIRMAFNILDKDSSGFITVDEVEKVYDVSWNPDVRSGKKTPKEAMRDFMSQWDRIDKDGVITPEEFEDYYKEISASIDDDDYFELMIRNAWRIAGGVGAAANSANKRVLITRADGTQYVETVNDELGMKAGDVDAVKERLGRQGVSAANVELFGGLDTTEKPKAQQRGRPSSAPPRKSQAQNQGSSPRPGSGGQLQQRPKASPRNAEFDPASALKTILYTPPVALEQLGVKLQVSVASSCPRVAQGAFCTRLQTLDASLDKKQVAAVWSLLDPSGSGSATLEDIYNFLSSKFGKDKSSKSSSVLDRVKAKILERCGGPGGGGIKGLTRTLAIMDDNGDKRLDKIELRTGLKDYGIELNIREMDDVFSYFDRDHNGFVDVDEFLVGMRGELNERRQKLVLMAFNILDTDGSGIVTVDEVAAKYDVSANPEVISGKKTKEQAIRDFMKQWEKQENDGLINLSEFEDYYKEISASIDGDDYFELMIRNSWRIAGGEGACANTANKRVLVTRADGTQYVETVNDELGMKAGDVDQIKERLTRQGVKADSVGLFGGGDFTEKPKKPAPKR